jgi:hypothetical protein
LLSRSTANTANTLRTILLILRRRLDADFCAGSTGGNVDGAGSSGGNVEGASSTGGNAEGAGSSGSPEPPFKPLSQTLIAVESKRSPGQVPAVWDTPPPSTANRRARGATICTSHPVVVQRYEGTVGEFTGDGIMAVLGGRP